MRNYSRVPSEEGEEPSIPSESSSRTRKALITVTALLAAGALSAVAVSSVSYSGLSQFSEVAPELSVSNEYERARGRQLFDGNIENLVQVFKSTRLALKSGEPAIFTVKFSESDTPVQVNSDYASSVEHMFTNIGEHQVEATLQDGSTHTFKTIAKVIRHELRDLNENDRTEYFEAMSIFQTLTQTEGEALYGKAYKSLAHMLRDHIYGAADKECDHWHDDAGMYTHHVGITMEMENSIRLINPAVASHYWDYTREGSRGVNWYDSNIFDDSWFGSNSPNNPDHIVDKGRFAFTPVFDGRGFSEIVNPYGLLRSPWNTNPTPYLLRYNKTFFDLADENAGFPTCNQFSTTFGKSFAEVVFSANGGLHGPLHIMIGGHWGSKHVWKPIGKGVGHPDEFLLLSKWLWRQGFVRTPDSCSADTPHSDCMPTCPEGIIGSSLTSDKAYDILSKAGIFDLATDKDFGTLLKNNSLTYVDLLQELCHIGSPGDSFSSAAPQDPIFWPLHGNVERLVMLLRVLKAKGKINFDETWGYEHSTSLPSDTSMVCDWSGVTGELEMPTCTKGVCPGHKEDDLLPFTRLYPGQTSEMTNGEFLKYLNPFNEKLSYAYDSLEYWEGCTDKNLYQQYLSSSTSTESKVKSWSDYFKGIWSVM